MTTYDFDQVIDRAGTGAIKLDLRTLQGLDDDVLPLWVADMDLPAPRPVLDALHERVEHGIFGYTMAQPAYYHAVQDWFERRHGWRPERSWFVMTPGVVYAFRLAIRALTQPGDAVLVQRPVYYPFMEAVEGQGRTLVNVPLTLAEGRYGVDLDAFEQAIVDNHVKLFLLCNPHNPVGRVWTRDELERMGDICLAHGVIVVSDEIHADFAYEGHVHVPFASIKPAFEAISITCTAPSKTFNLAGLQTSNLFVPDEELRHALKDRMHAEGLEAPNALGLVACQAAYEHGGEWLDQLKALLVRNLAYLKDFCAQELPDLVVMEPESTYLVWVDCRKLGMTHEQLKDFFLHEAKIWLDDGAMFGPEGEGFMRFNIATPPAILEEALVRLRDALRKAGY